MQITCLQKSHSQSLVLPKAEGRSKLNALVLGPRRMFMDHEGMTFTQTNKFIQDW